MIFQGFVCDGGDLIAYLIFVMKIISSARQLGDNDQSLSEQRSRGCSINPAFEQCGVLCRARDRPCDAYRI